MHLFFTDRKEKIVTTTEDDKKILKKIKYLERSLKKNSLSQTKKRH
jgi:hypothetical protein